MIEYSIIVPMYNEAKRKDAIIAHLRSIQKYFEAKGKSYEIIIVLDGSKDRTPAIVSEIAKQIPAIKIIERKKNKGKGATVKQGMLAASGKIRLFTDADGSTPIKTFSSAENYIARGADIVIGSRKVVGAVIPHKQSLLRRIGSNCGGLLIRAPLGLWRIRDTQCGFKVFTDNATKKIFNRLTIDRFGFDFEILVIVKQLGFSIKEIPVVWNDVGDSSVGFKNYLATFFEVMRVFFNRILKKY